MLRYQLGWLGVLACVALGPGQALAQTSADAVGAAGAPAQAPASANDAAASSARARARAHDHFVLGVNFYRARNYREALREFELSSALVPSADVWFNIGRAHEELGEYAQAAIAFERYVRDHASGSDVPAVRAQIARLESLAAAAGKREPDRPMYGSLRIHHRSEQLQVFLDGRMIEPGALESPLLLAAGKHRFDVVEPKHIPLHAMVDIQPGLLTTAYADLRPTTRARMRSADHGLDFALFGVAGASALVSATFAVLSIAQRADGTPNAMRSSEAWARRADLALAGTALCGLAAALLFLHAQRSAPTELLPAAAGSP